ncbi:protoglobin domain-containing protein [Thalassobaculum sp. OXR-137]|uniref:protoglobin domain-containing protein n=1 Tax=Thalassobaculum sp. OXR-137 TaxID=3100173 RepID=UPI002AC8D163|nr:protoglobin domain-containing protein [Thalassobaculum sp. OXR-137]WPZ35870.1 protoglobin domain-containing protein [Thalassobaculum sp. OXR-137]
MQFQDHEHLSQFDHRRTPLADREEHRQLAAAGHPGRAPDDRRHANWGIFKRRFWGDSLRYQHLIVGKLIKQFDSRLRLDSIDDNVRTTLKLFCPIIDEHMPSMIAEFYQHMTSFPQTSRFFVDRDVNYLKARQSAHWRMLFAADFSPAYIRGAVRVGLVHHYIGLPLYLYLSGYNRILCELASLAITHHAGAMASTNVVSSIIKVVSLDMDIAISCYFLADHLDLKTKNGTRGVFDLSD